MVVVTVERWTGREAALLRKALRMSLREFAKYLGVAERTVSYWERAGSAVVPRHESQAILDTCLETAGRHAQQRFTVQVSTRTAEPALDVTPLWHSVDGKAMARVPGGGDGPDSPPGFHIDVTPVTNAEYSVFVTATGHRPPRHWNEGGCPAGIEDHPVVQVTHGDATAYAAWAGKLLPTREQWEKAARGEAGNPYPWGDRPTAAKCNVRQSRIGRTTPVYRYHSGVSEYGVYDLAGNVWEWCSTPTADGRFVVKGSAFTSPFQQAEVTAVNDAAATACEEDIGFRTVVFEDSTALLSGPLRPSGARGE